MKTKLSLFVGLLLLQSFAYNGYAQTKTLPDELSDTTLVKTNFAENDSILKYRKSHEFSYMHYLDSLLRKQKAIRSDTVSIDENTGKIMRHHSAAKEIPAFTFLNSLPLKIFFWTLAIIFIVFISYKVLFKNGIFVRRKNKFVPENYEASVEELDDISKYDALISDAEKRNDLNLATRYLFLKTLKTLADKEVIHFTADKTNRDYIREMQQNYDSSEFKNLVRDYEYAWYGKFFVDKNKYENMKEAFTSFNQKV